jgi:hypothetical protein
MKNKICVIQNIKILKNSLKKRNTNVEKILKIQIWAKLPDTIGSCSKS